MPSVAEALLLAAEAPHNSHGDWRNSGGAVSPESFHLPRRRSINFTALFTLLGLAAFWIALLWLAL
jgi:hypothetical protein